MRGLSIDTLGRRTYEMEQHLLVVNNLVQVGNVDNAAVAVETDHCKKKFHLMAFKFW